MLAAGSSPVSGLVFTVAVLATSMALVAALAWASRRLLGLSVGVLRALIAGLLGFAVAALLGQALRAAQPGHEVAFLSVALGVPLIVAMIFLVAAEALVPTGTGPGPVEVVRGARRAIARSRRYSQISRVAVRHGLGPYLRGRRLGRADAASGRAALAASLRRALEEGGVTFTKLGQLLSTRRDLLPEEFISELGQLQDRAEPAPWEQVEEVIVQSLGVPAAQVFAELDPVPAAAASIAQVYKARLRRGDGSDAEVAVKVQRPGIRAIPAEVGTVLRALATMEGTLTLVEPGFDLVVEARQYAASHVTGQLSPRAVQKTAAEELMALLPVLRRLPRRADHITGAMEQGRFSVNVRLFADERDRRVVTDLTHRFLLTLLGAATGSGAVLLIGAPGGPEITPTVSLFQVIGYNLLIVASILVLRVLFAIFRSR